MAVWREHSSHQIEKGNVVVSRDRQYDWRLQAFDERPCCAKLFSGGALGNVAG